MLVFLIPVFLCGCADTAESDALMLNITSESDTAQTRQENEEAVQDAGDNEEIGQIYIYICGAVKNPGVYQADSGSRLFEVIEMAGGFMPEADRESLNLARNVTDGEQIVVITEEAAKKMTAVSENAAAQQDGGPVNINTASLSELTQVSGIGESRAQAIIAYRERNGAFKSVEEIKKVDGIKDGLFSKIKDYITV